MELDEFNRLKQLDARLQRQYSEVKGRLDASKEAIQDELGVSADADVKKVLADLQSEKLSASRAFESVHKEFEAKFGRTIYDTEG